MTRRIALLALLATATLAEPSLAFRSTDSTPRQPVATNTTREQAEGVIDLANKNGALAEDMYRLAFKQMMGLVFFDPTTPSTDNCQKEMLDYYLPELVKQQVSLELVKSELARHMAEVYTPQELAWLTQFYNSPFGANMLKKQLEMNTRITRIMAQRYTAIKPQLEQTYKTVAARCESGSPELPTSAPASTDALLGTEEGTTP